MSEGLRKNKKKIMAVLVIILMIVFIIDIGVRRGGPDESANELIGLVGNDESKVTVGRQREAAAEWNLLTRGEIAGFAAEQLGAVLVSNLNVQGQDFMSRILAMQAMQMMQPLVNSLDERTYMLLVLEAERLGISINRDRVESMRSGLANFPSADPETRERAVLNWLNVVEVFNRVARSVKVSPAHAVHEVAEQQQQVSLDVVPFSAADYKQQVPEPTGEQLQAFFEKYRNVDAETNEFGIGYRFPDRVKVEYVKVPKEAIAKTVTDEDIYKYWKDNQSQFQRLPDTQPVVPEGPLGPAATMPTTAPTTAVASTQPTTRPWTEVKDQIRDIIAQQRANVMATAITQNLRADWPNFREALRAAGASASATRPSSAQTSLGVPYNSYPYLQELQKRVQKQKESRGVLPELFWDDNFLTRRELEQLPGLGQARMRDGRQIPFPVLATESVEPFLSEAQRRQVQENNLGTLALYQPSPIFVNDKTGDLFVFRLTDAQAAHPAESLGVVESRVREDWKSVQAYELAREAARKFLEEAKGKGLAQAAGDRKVINTGLFRNDPRAESLPTYTLSPQATRKLIAGGFDLLAKRVSGGDEHPLGVIDLPRAFTAVVSRVAEATPATRDEYFTHTVQQQQQMQEFQRITQMMFKWFNPDAVEQRVKFKPSDPTDRPSRRAPQAPPPMFPGI
jgi:hypothetical protein